MWFQNFHCAVKTVFSLFPAIFFELPITRPFFRFPLMVRVIGSQSKVYYRLPLSRLKQPSHCAWAECSYLKVISFFFSHQMIEEPETRSRASYYVADSHGAVYPIVRSVSGLKSKNILKPSFLKRICGLPSHITKDTLGIALNNFCRVLFPLAFLLFNLIYWLVIAT